MTDDKADALTGEGTRSLFVAMLGAPNAGKSTLVNALVGAKVAIVTHKVQTTRAITRGIVMDGKTQVVLVDTPGVFAPKRRLDEVMVRTAWGGASDADLVCLLIDARRGLDAENAELIDALRNVAKPRYLVLNKIDLLPRERLLALVAELNEALAFDETFLVSALTGDGVGDLRRALVSAARPGPWFYSDDQLSDLPVRQLAAEVTREKLMLRVHDELPYQIHVETESWKTLRSGAVRVEQTIYVTRDGHKKIVIGAGGATIKAIGAEARAELKALLETDVQLFLFVKVRDWLKDPERYIAMGLDYDG
ncbi:MAG: GTPase Era [Pseudomonadota bacterium]